MISLQALPNSHWPIDDLGYYSMPDVIWAAVFSHRSVLSLQFLQQPSILSCASGLYRQHDARKASGLSQARASSYDVLWSILALLPSGVEVQGPGFPGDRERLGQTQNRRVEVVFSDEQGQLRRHVSVFSTTENPVSGVFYDFVA
jgi:hypothetical protein